ncbi:type VI secretion system-associated FHA domain protein TagH [Parahaliea aestuarii]|uniref:Type VI secretion system-associated FHA domain protein TagH n=1 Tax=Parahaliea aestuarii TaxID=1852021 RepID=A0A5C8ZY44_9GAMM|nr:type VI secretion system-associated FHA domain protein TagH [Parahaliea aestuarii]TXS93388.1 type VI secretion system-associated FHA domain protein TagH [Parahaliea aestuarii]
MQLSIKVVRAPTGCHQMVGERFSFVDRGLTFGRAQSNDLVLPDPLSFVSSRHGLVEFSQGRYTVYDQSTNGLFLDGDLVPLGVGNSAELGAVTELRVGEYLLLFEVSEGGVAAAEAPAPKPAAADVISFDQSHHTAVSDDDMAVELALRLGLHGMSESRLHSLPDEVTALLRSCIGNVMEVLSARRQVKQQLKMDNTVIQRSDNNALKVSATADDAIERMFAKSGDAYLPPEQALVEAFHDIGDHQVAMMAATLQVYQQVVARFEPSALEAKLPAAKGAGKLFSGKGKLWEDYTNLYESIAANGADSVHEAFLREFSAAYSENLRKLKKERQKHAS